MLAILALSCVCVAPLEGLPDVRDAPLCNMHHLCRDLLHPEQVQLAIRLAATATRRLRHVESIGFVFSLRVVGITGIHATFHRVPV